jgi:predicted MFS family arabinose efflux permease
MPFMNSFWIKRTTETNRGQYAAMYTIAWSIAQIAAPTLGSQVVEQFGYNVLWWILPAICLIASAGFMVLGSKINDLTPDPSRSFGTGSPKERETQM